MTREAIIAALCRAAEELMPHEHNEEATALWRAGALTAAALHILETTGIAGLADLADMHGRPFRLMIEGAQEDEAASDLCEHCGCPRLDHGDPPDRCSGWRMELDAKGNDSCEPCDCPGWCYVEEDHPREPVE